LWNVLRQRDRNGSQYPIDQDLLDKHGNLHKVAAQVLQDPLEGPALMAMLKDITAKLFK